MSCKGKGGYIAIFIGVFISLYVANKSHAETKNFQGIQITVEKNAARKNSAIFFIPGLNSSSDVFESTCTVVKAEYDCYLIQLPGFAGQASIDLNNKAFLITQRDAIESYIRQMKLNKVILVGHSLGGLLSLMISLDAPELVQKIVIIDSLPFYSAIQNPAATAESVKPFADQMRKGMLNQSQDEYQKNLIANLQGLTNKASRIDTLANWGKASDRTTTANALYEIMTTDLRDKISAVKSPTLVLGSWAAYQAYGSTKESTRAIFSAQYAALKGVDIRMSETGFHFLMWDDADWVNQQISEFLKK